MKYSFVLLLISVLFSCTPDVIENTPNYFISTFAFDTLDISSRYDSVYFECDSVIPINEASGGIASNKFKGDFWTINDSGNEPLLFLIDGTTGVLKLQLNLQGTKNLDWESLDSYVDDSGTSKIVVCDFGDNFEVRPFVTAYIFEEPSASVIDTNILDQSYFPSKLDSVKFTYETGPKDVEAFFVDPISNDWYFISKREPNNRLYKLEEPGAIAIDTAILVGEFPFYMTTAADCKKLSNNSYPIIIKNYERVMYWERSNNQSVEQALSELPELIPYGQREPQGEAIWFWPNGDVGTCSEWKGEKPKPRRYIRL